MATPFVPDSFVAPTGFEGEGFHLEPLGPVHNERDHEAWMSSIEHAREFRDREGFTYSILDGDEVIGCIYIYPPKVDGTDARVSSWVRESRAEMDTVVWRAMSTWLTTDWPFEHLDYAPRD